MKNRISKKVGVKSPKTIVKISRSRGKEGDVIFSSYSDGTCAVRIKGLLNERLHAMARDRKTTFRKMVLRAFSKKRINQAVEQLMAEKGKGARTH